MVSLRDFFGRVTMKERVTYILSRVLELVITLLIVSLLTFAAFSIIPGDTASVLLGINASPAQLEALREKLGLNDPLWYRYLSWLKGAFTGDLGDSTAFGKPVAELIVSRLPVTFGLSFLSLILVLVISYPSAVISSGHQEDLRLLRRRKIRRTFQGFLRISVLSFVTCFLRGRAKDRDGIQVPQGQHLDREKQ